MRRWIVYEELGFMVVDKPAGILSQKDKSGVDDLATLMLKDFAKSGSHFSFLAPVHRLDRNTSGLIILAKDSEHARTLSEWMKDGKINRTYLAIVKGDPGANGRFEFRLKKNERTNEVSVNPNGEEAVTEFQRIQKLGNSSILRIRLLTGKSHQIRVHLSHAGHSLIGDKKYAKKPWSEIFGRPALHAAEIELPDSKSHHLKTIRAPIPGDIQSLILKLGGKPL